MNRHYDQSPADAYLYAQIATDSWAYGKLLSVIAKKSGPGLVREKLQEVCDDSTKAEWESRIGMGAALEYLETVWEKASL